jgi:hypothetical protein
MHMSFRIFGFQGLCWDSAGMLAFAARVPLAGCDAYEYVVAGANRAKGDDM